jgi:hypothetical protein
MAANREAGMDFEWLTSRRRYAVSGAIAITLYAAPGANLLSETQYRILLAVGVALIVILVVPPIIAQFRPKVEVRVTAPDAWRTWRGRHADGAATPETEPDAPSRGVSADVIPKDNPTHVIGTAGPVPSVSSRWLPDRSDFSTCGLTESDLDDALIRARAKAIEVLAPDMEIELAHFELAPNVCAAFRAWSQIADRFVWVYAFERGVSTTNPKRGSGSTTYKDEREVSVWREAIPPHWKAHSGWDELIRQVGYRLRPFVGKAQLGPHVMASFTALTDPDDWVVWHVCATREADDDGERKTQCFGLRAGKLVLFE